MMISVIIPTRNNARYLIERLGPLFRQTLSPDEYEIIVVNNASTDRTEQVLAQLSSEVRNLRCVAEPIMGRSEARNRGIRESCGDLIVFLDDDIEVQTDHLERHRAYHLQAISPIAVVGHVTDVSPIEPAWLADYFYTRQIGGSQWRSSDGGATGGLHFVTQSVSVKRETLELARMAGEGQPLYFDPSLKWRHDGDMGCRLAKAGVLIVRGEDIHCSHHHPRDLRAIWQRSYQIGYDTVRLLEKHPEVRNNVRNLTASSLLNLGLLVICMGLFLPAFAVRPLWPELFRKVIGGLLYYQSNRGYRQALLQRHRP